MTTIVADIRDSQGASFNGYIQITLDYQITDPDEIVEYLVVPSRVNLSTGQATFDLEPSETQRVTYRFEVYKEVSLTEAVLYLDFRAKVPASLTPISLASLSRQTGIVRDAMDSNLSAVVSRLVNEPNFWDRLQTMVFRTRGTYDAAEWYRLGDNVTWEGNTYRCISQVNIRGVLPTDATNWFQWTAKGDPGAGITGEDYPYDDAGWNGSTAAPSKNAVRDIVETLATKDLANSKVAANGAILTLATLGDTLALTDRTSRIAYASWVQDLLDVVRKAVNPVGILAPWLTGSPPQYWILLDGRTVSRTTYADLFTLWSTTYGVGNGTTTFNLPDFRGRGFTMVDSSPIQGAANRLTGVTTVGATGGLSKVVLTSNELPAHSHASGGGVTPNLMSFVSSGGTLGVGAGTNVALHATTANAGSGQSHENMPPYFACNVIAYAGI